MNIFKRNIKLDGRDFALEIERKIAEKLHDFPLSDKAHSKEWLTFGKHIGFYCDSIRRTAREKLNAQGDNVG